MGSGGSGSSSGNNGGAGMYSPAKEKAACRGSVIPCCRLGGGNIVRRFRQVAVQYGSSGMMKVRVMVIVWLVFAIFVLVGRVASFMGWRLHMDRTTFSRGGYTVIVNTWKREALLKRSVTHYASCSGTDAIHVVWSESDPPSESLKIYLKKAVQSKSSSDDSTNIKFDVNEGDSLNNRFKPIKDLRTEAVFSVDDDVLVPCRTLDFAFTVWQSASNTMVGFVPRMHWLDKETDSIATYKYGGWWSVWWMGTYSMVLSKAAFFHRKYLDLYTYKMSSAIRDYVTRERNCEDIAMSLLVANATGAPPIWVKGVANSDPIRADLIRSILLRSGCGSQLRHPNQIRIDPIHICGYG